MSRVRALFDDEVETPRLVVDGGAQCSLRGGDATREPAILRIASQTTLERGVEAALVVGHVAFRSMT